MPRTLAARPRTAVALVALGWGWALFAYAALTFPTARLAWSFLTRASGLTALALLFLVFVPGILRARRPAWRVAAPAIHARRAVGLSMAAYVAAHVALGFTVQLSGSFSAILYLPLRFRIALLAALLALLIVAAMASTSWDGAVRRLGYARWKRLHRAVYLLFPLVLFHAFFLGSNFSDAASPLRIGTAFAAVLLMLLALPATVPARIPGQPFSRRVLEFVLSPAFAFAAVLVIILLGSSHAHAHSLVIADGVGITMHVSPGDEPRSGEPATIVLHVVERATGRGIAGEATVTVDGPAGTATQNVALLDGEGAIAHVFDPGGSYAVRVAVGERRARFELYVSGGTRSADGPLRAALPFVTIAAVSLALILLLGPRRPPHPTT